MKYIAFIFWIPFISACNSLSLFKESDCRQTSEHYGSCFADLGYNVQAYSQLQQYCRNLGIDLKDESFNSTRISRQKEICSTPNGVFRQSFRSRVGVNGPVMCPSELITSAPLKKAKEEGSTAAYRYLNSEDRASAAKKAEKRREDADRDGFWSGLGDRILYSPQRIKASSEQEFADFKKILASYPGNDESSLTERLKCNSDGWL